MSRYGWYSWHEEEKTGSWYWIKKDGTFVVVTNISNTVEKPEGIGPFLFLGEIQSRVFYAGKKRYMKLNICI